MKMMDYTKAENIPVSGKKMENNTEATKDMSVKNPKDFNKISGTYKNEKSMPNSIPTNKYADGMIPVAGKDCGK